MLGISPYKFPERIIKSSLYSEITYPATFNASNTSVYEFGIDKKDNVYVEIPGFNAQSSNPIVYDLSNNNRYEINNEAILKINLVATTLPKNNIYISAQNSTSINIINNLSKVFSFPYRKSYKFFNFFNF